METVTQNPTNRKPAIGPDGLTRDERQRLYLPELYRVERLSDTEYRVSHREVEAAFYARETERPGELFVKSNTNGAYFISEDVCECRDNERNSGSRLCKHRAVARAVETFRLAEQAPTAEFDPSAPWTAPKPVTPPPAQILSVEPGEGGHWVTFRQWVAA
jgi:hypothetical protein